MELLVALAAFITLIFAIIFASKFALKLFNRVDGQMKRRTLVLLMLNLLLWGGLAWLGYSGEVSVEQRVGHVSLEQVSWYVIFPLGMLLVATVPPLLFSQTKWQNLGTAWSIIALAPFFPYLCMSGGGV